MSDAEAIEAEAIVRDLASIDPSVGAEYACFFCGAGDPVDRPTIHADDCLHLRAARWTERRWERDEGWREDAVQRLEAVRDQLRQGRQASRGHVERILAALEAGIDETE
ncbi:MAG: hypothetical protein EA388_15585 [Nitriliruptor sp.]|nr:MAG: hypothetical protein EA388_15585 [Nitriliruptor sp.]